MRHSIRALLLPAMIAIVWTASALAQGTGGGLHRQSPGQDQLVISPDAAWRETDTLDIWTARLRDLSVGLGLPCEQVRAIGDGLDQFSLSIDGHDDLAVGGSLRIDWTGNTLTTRVPIWLMVSTEAPVRFSGTGFMALGPDTRNPFGIETGLGRTRALVPLYSAAAPRSGGIDVHPLVEGDFDMTVDLVGYARACRTEMPFRSSTLSFEAGPGPARIVRNTEEGRGAYLHELRLDALNRRVLIAETRVLVLDATSGTEILQRSGQDISVSPTQRFLVLKEDRRLDIVDVIDGATVASIDDGVLHWALGDSYAMTTLGPWGEVNIVSTFGGKELAREQVTGPACCLADPEVTRVGVDLENAAFSIWGIFGHAVGSLLDPRVAERDSPRGGYSANRERDMNLLRRSYAALAQVAPVSFGFGYEFAGGTVADTGLDAIWSLSEDERENLTFGDRLGLRLAPFGLSPRPRPFSFVAASNTGLAAQLGRMGVGVQEMIEGEVVLPEAPNDIPESYNYDPETGEWRHAYRGRSLYIGERLTALAQDAAAAGWRFRWSDESAAADFMSECIHVDLTQINEAGQELFLVRDLGFAVRLPVGPAPLWVTQSWCTAGATFGSLRPTTVLFVHDFAGPVPRASTDLVMHSAFFFENDPSPLWFDHPFSIRGNDAHVLLIAEGNGVIALYDRALGRVTHVLDSLPDGDLLRSAHLSEDVGFIVQENADGAFHIHRLETGSLLGSEPWGGQRVLSGRVADDEIVVWTGDFLFDATAEAAQLVDLVFPGRAREYSLDRFGAAQRVEGLALRVLAGAQLPPVPRIGIPPDIRGTIEDEGGRIVAAVEVLTGDVAEFALFQDGVLVERVPAPADGSPLVVDRLPGSRWASVVALDAEGLASAPVSADLGPAADAARQRALVIGVNTYLDPNVPDLNLAASDARLVADALAEAERGFDQVTLLTDTEARRDRVLLEAEALVDGLGPGDHAVIYFAGHGLRGLEGIFYFGTSETHLQTLDETALSFEALAEAISQSPARLTIIVDACHSGAVGLGAFATGDDIAGGLADLPSNVTILAASKGRELSHEAPRFGGGVFTYALLDVIRDNRATHDRNRNGRIEASELYSGVKSIVVQELPGRQTPWMIQSRLVGEYAVF
jgi:hypothetical protein